MKNLISLIFFGIVAVSLSAQPGHGHKHTRVIHFPDLDTLHSVICDFHIHTVFSDGSVWPNIRVDEALRDSVDFISLTEHIEYQPHSADIPHPDRNRAYEIAEKAARPYPLGIVRGAEITRSMPPGHSNAIFIKDANKLMIEDSLEVFKEVQRQGGFTFWNHPNWTAQREDGVARLTDFHWELIANDLLHGIEVVNDLTYSDEALQIALDHDLTIMGTSDIHGLVDWQYGIADGGHRPITVVLAREHTAEGVKEALFDGRTVVFYENMLIGKAENVQPLITASLQVKKAQYQGILPLLDIDIYNDSSMEYILANKSNYGFHNSSDVIVIPARSTKRLTVKTLQQYERIMMDFEVLNAVTAPNTHADIRIAIDSID